MTDPTIFSVDVKNNQAMLNIASGGTYVFDIQKMSKMQVVQRLLSIEAKVDLHRLRTGRLRDKDWRHLRNTVVISGL